MNRAVFLDRDGVINAMVYDQEGILDSPYDPEQFELLPGVGEGVRKINEMGLLVILISNQPGVAKGKCTLQILEAIAQKMEANLAALGARLDASYYCLHHPQAIIEEYRINCNCRKPKPGLLLKAAEELAIDLKSSYMIGDKPTDVQAGQAAGCKTILLDRHHLLGPKDKLDPEPDFIAADLLETVRHIYEQEAESGNLYRFSER